MQVFIENVTILPNVPKNYTYTVHKNKKNECNTIFQVNEIKSRKDFFVWKRQLEEDNKENYSFYYGRNGKEDYIRREVWVCHHAERARKRKIHEKETEPNTEKKRKEMIEPVFE